MSGIMNKIGETLHIGGNKKEDEHHGEHHKSGEHKEGMVDKMKDKIPGGQHEHGHDDKHHGHEHGDKHHGHDGEKKKKKDKKDKKKKHEDGHSSSDSDSD